MSLLDYSSNGLKTTNAEVALVTNTREINSPTLERSLTHSSRTNGAVHFCLPCDVRGCGKNRCWRSNKNTITHRCPRSRLGAENNPTTFAICLISVIRASLCWVLGVSIIVLAIHNNDVVRAKEVRRLSHPFKF